jgi:hypothetical protein
VLGFKGLTVIMQISVSGHVVGVEGFLILKTQGSIPCPQAIHYDRDTQRIPYANAGIILI